MINSREDLKYYLEEDRKAYGKPNDITLKQKIVSLLFKDRNYEYVKCLRKLEYYIKTGGVLKYLYWKKLGKLQTKTGIDLQPNVAGPGLHITHGKVVVNHSAKIGNSCKDEFYM